MLFAICPGVGEIEPIPELVVVVVLVLDTKSGAVSSFESLL